MVGESIVSRTEHSRKTLSLISQPVFLWCTAWRQILRFLGARTWCWVLPVWWKWCILWLRFTQMHWIGSPALSNITAAPTATTVMQQVYIPVCLLTFSSQNVISHFHLWVNSRQHTEIISGFWLSARIENTFHLPSAPALTPSSFFLHSSFPFSHFTLIAPSPNLSGWFQACCVWPDLVSCDWNSNYDHPQIAFPPTEKSCC